MNARTVSFWTIVGLQAAFLLAWAGYHESVRSQAPVVRLIAHPVDPRDLVRGDSMQLSYDVGKTPIDLAGKPASTLRDGDTVWVVLERHGRDDEAVHASPVKPPLKPGQRLIRAEKSWSRLRLGIESYFVPEGKGTPRFKTIEVEAAVAPGGNLYIKRVLLDGTPYP